MLQIHWDRNEKTVVAELALQYIIGLCLRWLKEQFQVSILVARVQSRKQLSVALAQFLTRAYSLWKTENLPFGRGSELSYLVV